MRFDKTFIAIRDRSTLEIFDLSLHVMVDHFRPLFWLLVIGASPWILFDYWLIGWLTDSIYPVANFYWLMMLLVVNQAQVGTTFMTHYLGQAMFEGRPGIWATVRGVFKTTPYFLWIHGVIRMVIPVILLGLALGTDQIETFAFICFFITAFVFVGSLVRAFRPFVSEILLLERTPISKKDEKTIYFARRSQSLHGSGSDLFGRAITSAIFALLLGISCFSAFVTVDSVLLISNGSTFSLQPYYWIIALWMVAGFIAITRFLSYIDVRIRQEGWAVELRMRAEGQKLLKAMD